MIWENIKDFFILEKTGKDSLVELLEKSGYSNMIKEITDDKKVFMFSVGKGIYFIRIMRDIQEAEVYIGISRNDLELKSYDGIPVNMIVFLIFPMRKDDFVRLVSHFFRLLNIPSLRKEILKSNTADDVRSIFKREPI